MTNQTKNRQAKTNTAEKAFFYNIIVPDATILIIGLTTSFGSLLSVFS
ncbi:MAG: hypothetical protein AAF304_01300 [Pseudomonadota bacterium]